MKRKERGSVLIYVLVTAVMVAIVAAGLARLILMRHMAASRLVDGGIGHRAVEAGLNQLESAWVLNNGAPGVTNTACTNAPNAVPVGWIWKSGPIPAGGCNCVLSNPTFSYTPPGGGPPVIVKLDVTVGAPPAGQTFCTIQAQSTLP